MLTLAFESSAKPASVAVCSEEVLLGQYFQNSGLTHSRTLLAMAESLLRNLDLSVSDIELVSVARGPGSFTGVRIGVSAAKGLAWGLDVPICGVSSLEAMAYQVQTEQALICPVMDARRGQVYNGVFRWDGGNLARIREDRAISLEDLASDIASFGLPVLLLGDGAEISWEHFAGNGLDCEMAPVLLRYQTAYGVALAALKGTRIPPIDLEPSYLRPSQAERELG